MIEKSKIIVLTDLEFGKENSFGMGICNFEANLYINNRWERCCFNIIRDFPNINRVKKGEELEIKVKIENEGYELIEIL